MPIADRITATDADAAPLVADIPPLPSWLPCPVGHTALLLSLEYAAATITAYVCEQCLTVYRSHELRG